MSTSEETKPPTNPEQRAVSSSSPGKKSQVLSQRSQAPQRLQESKAALQRWFDTLRQRVINIFLRLFVRSVVVVGFISCAYLLGWWSPPATASVWRYAPMLTFPGLAIGLWIYGKHIDLPIRLHRWLMLIPAGFFLATLRHFAVWWVVLIFLGLCGLASILFHLFQMKKAPRGQRLLQTLWDMVLLGILTTHLFLPRSLFAAFFVFLPIVLLVVFYNFILERDRLLRAKALAIGDPPGWLNKANQLIPSTTYLLLLLPGLLFAEAMVFHATYQAMHPSQAQVCGPNAKADQPIPPKLRNWFMFTVTLRMKVKHCGDKRNKTGSEEATYWEFGRGYSLTASLIRAFLLFFYAKRLLLIYLLLMDSMYGIRVHRIGESQGIPGASARLEEHREVVQRTLDSFPRAWAGFVVRGIQGRHGILDPVGGLIHSIQWMRQNVLGRIHPKLAPAEPLKEAPWSRMVREEQLSLLGRMQDHAWALEAMIDMTSPAHSTTFRGKGLHLLDYPGLRNAIGVYFRQPEPEVRARVIEEIAALIGRAVRAERRKVVLQDVETDQLTHEQVWTLRDRALLVLKDLLADKEPCIRLAAARAIDAVADLPRPIRDDDIEIWRPLAATLAERIQEISPLPDRIAETDTDLHPILTMEDDDTSQVEGEDDGEKDNKDEATYPDPFAAHARHTLNDEQRALVSALGRVGIEESIEWLDALREDDLVSTARIFYALGLGEQANGRPHAGFAAAQDILLAACQHAANDNHRRIALKSLARIAFPQPLADAFERFVKLRRELHRQKRQLLRQEKQLEQVEAARKAQGGFGIAQREALREAYRQLRLDATAHEALALETFGPLHDTFWSTVHYAAVVVIGAFMQGEGFDQHHQFSEHLQELSLEDIQGWDEFFANLPPLQDRTSWVAPFYQFLIWISETEGGQRTRIQRFIELKTLTQTAQGGREGMSQWQELFALVSRYEQHLLEVLSHFTDCLRVRPVLVTCLDEGEGESWWRVTLSGLQPWLQPLQDAPAHMRPDRLYLTYEQYRPLEFHPLTQVTWKSPLNSNAMTHGHAPPPQFWSFSLSRATDLILRKLGDSEGRGYWRAVEHPGDSEYWHEQVSRLLSLQRSIPLDELTLNYLHDRSHAGYQITFSRSRLREQDPLMIRREMATKLDNFLEHDRRQDPNAPSLFLLAGNASMGHSTLLLQHVREQYQQNLAAQTELADEVAHDAPQRIALFADVGLFEPGESLPEWLYRELHIALTPELQTVCQGYDCDVIASLSPFYQRLAALLADSDQRKEFVFYLDGFHEHPNGIELFAEALAVGIWAHTNAPWSRTILSIRQTYLEQNLNHPAMTPYLRYGTFAPPEAMFYREKGGLHGMMIKLTAFLDEPTPISPKGRSELERAFGQYHDYTDTSGAPRYRPTRQIADLEPFGMTRALLTRPSLLPVIMETYHQKSLPDDLQVLALFAKFLRSFSQPERDFFDALIERMLFGGVAPTLSPMAWQSSTLLEEEQLLDDTQLAEFIEPFKYGTRLYDELRARGILIRRWRLSHNPETQEAEQTRHVTFTSHQLQEYLLFRLLWKIAPGWEPAPTTVPNATPAEDAETSEATGLAGATVETSAYHLSDPVGWLLALAEHSRHFRPLEGALMLLLLHLIEQHHYAIIADFNDRSTTEGSRGRHILFDALLHLDPRVLTRPGGAFETILKDMSANDLELLQDLSRHYKHRSLYPEVEALCALVLDQPKFAQQLQQFPDHMTDLLLERADNRRQVLGRRTGGRLERDDYLAGREYYEQALKRVQRQTDDDEQQTRVLRYLAQYEMDTNHWEEAARSLHQAWQSAEKLQQHDTQKLLHKAWIRHLQSALQRRRAEPPHTLTEELQQKQIREARELGEEALKWALQCPESDRLELLAQIYDNLGRIYHQLAPAAQPDEAMAAYEQAITCFEGSIQAKRTLNDYLGMAISHSGLGSVFLDRARQRGSKEEPERLDWDKARDQFSRALRLNRDKLKSDFGVALGHQALAHLYLAHPDHHGDGLAELVEALSAYARIKNTQGCHDVIQQLVKEIAKLPLQEMHRFLKQLVSELQHVSDLSEWLLRTLWDEFAAVLGNRIPKFMRDLFAKFMQS